MAGRLWLMKSEPSVYSLDDLLRDGHTGWEGVRNFQARNMLRDDFAVGDLVLFYHSSCDRVGVVGVARVRRAGYPDPTQFEPGHTYQDPTSPQDNPRWFTVDVEPVEAFHDVVPLSELKADPSLAGMLLLQKGQRLSVQPVNPAHFERVRALGQLKGPTRPAGG